MRIRVIKNNKLLSALSAADHCNKDHDRSNKHDYQHFFWTYQYSRHGHFDYLLFLCFRNSSFSWDFPVYFAKKQEYILHLKVLLWRFGIIMEEREKYIILKYSPERHIYSEG